MPALLLHANRQRFMCPAETTTSTLLGRHYMGCHFRFIDFPPPCFAPFNIFRKGSCHTRARDMHRCNRWTASGSNARRFRGSAGAEVGGCRERSGVTDAKDHREAWGCCVGPRGGRWGRSPRARCVCESRRSSRNPADVRCMARGPRTRRLCASHAISEFQHRPSTARARAAAAFCCATDRCVTRGSNGRLSDNCGACGDKGCGDDMGVATTLASQVLSLCGGFIPQATLW